MAKAMKNLKRFRDLPIGTIFLMEIVGLYTKKSFAKTRHKKLNSLTSVNLSSFKSMDWTFKNQSEKVMVIPNA